MDTLSPGVFSCHAEQLNTHLTHLESSVELSATGEPDFMHEDTQVHVGIDLRPGSLTLTRDGKDFAVHHALVEFVSVPGKPWTADKVKFSAEGPDRKSVGLTVDLLNDTWSGPRAGVPAAVWKVVALAATSAGDVGITYSHPDPA
ncbi:hypothetical protein [Streptomyces sp. NPDC088766]|uniref:hypothetical protein n=1 Tax=Streptomyces sp. NPDC088766 TaxID=3365893 RepID=UPI00381D4078